MLLFSLLFISCNACSLTIVKGNGVIARFILAEQGDHIIARFPDGNRQGFHRFFSGTDVCVYPETQNRLILYIPGKLPGIRIRITPKNNHTLHWWPLVMLSHLDPTAWGMEDYYELASPFSNALGDYLEVLSSRKQSGEKTLITLRRQLRERNEKIQEWPIIQDIGSTAGFYFESPDNAYFPTRIDSLYRRGVYKLRELENFDLFFSFDAYIEPLFLHTLEQNLCCGQSCPTVNTYKQLLRKIFPEYKPPPAEALKLALLLAKEQMNDRDLHQLYMEAFLLGHGAFLYDHWLTVFANMQNTPQARVNTYQWLKKLWPETLYHDSGHTFQFGNCHLLTTFWINFAPEVNVVKRSIAKNIRSQRQVIKQLLQLMKFLSGQTDYHVELDKHYLWLKACLKRPDQCKDTI